MSIWFCLHVIQNWKRSPRSVCWQLEVRSFSVVFKKLYKSPAGWMWTPYSCIWLHTRQSINFCACESVWLHPKHWNAPKRLLLYWIIVPLRCINDVSDYSTVALMIQWSRQLFRRRPYSLGARFFHNDWAHFLEHYLLFNYLTFRKAEI